MAINIELRRKVNGSFTDENSVLHPITTPQNIIGLLDNGKIQETLLPASVFGGMRFAGALSANITTGTENDLVTDSTLGAIINAYIAENGGTAIGVYFVASNPITITASSAETFAPIQGGAAEEEGVQTNTVSLESNDWIICKGVGTNGEYIFSVVNNTYRTVDSNHAGLMTSAQNDKLAGIAENANAYVHATHTERNIDTSGVDVLDAFTSDAEGHVTNISTRTLPNATTSSVGVIQLATGNELTTSLTNQKATHSTGVKTMLDYFTGNTLYDNVANANAASHNNGAIVFVTYSPPAE